MTFGMDDPVYTIYLFWKKLLENSNINNILLSCQLIQLHWSIQGRVWDSLFTNEENEVSGTREVQACTIQEQSCTTLQYTVYTGIRLAS